MWYVSINKNKINSGLGPCLELLARTPKILHEKHESTHKTMLKQVEMELTVLCIIVFAKE